ncbi:MAG: tRNA 2-selenouridine(34) synthase MnmH [Pedobacter sp.]
MSRQPLLPEKFLQQAAQCPVFDARSPSEYHKGHIPGAHNLPLFSDAERHEIGILYKQQGREQAVTRGLEIVGPRLTEYIAQVKKITDAKTILVHCWRGGMRSESLAWLLGKVGYRVGLLKGGYKAYRQCVLESFEQPLQLLVLGGMTGSGKTEMLHNLQRRGQQVLDLEGLACHRGSAFGAMDDVEQPSTEQFENDVHAALQGLQVDQPIWVEDESRKIGRVSVPEALFKQMRSAPLVRVHVSREIRVQRLCSDYGNVAPEKLADAVHNISKRLGGEKTKLALQAIADGDYATATHAILDYYDKTYLFGISKRNPTRTIDLDPTPELPGAIATALSEIAREVSGKL